MDTFISDYIASRTDVKERTTADLRQTHRRLVEYFGKGRTISSITPADADKFVIHLRASYAIATASKSVVNARQFFRRAIRARLIHSNPFDGIKCGDQTNPERQHYVTREDTAKILEACPNAEWRAIVALARFGGLRCPTEVLRLQWDDVDFVEGRFTVHATKTEHHANRGIRRVPLFPELRQHLWELFELAEPGTVYVINRYRDARQNLRTTFAKIVARAGVDLWDKPFQNMRASAETDLAGKYPLHVIANWIGHTPAVAMRHYLQLTESDMKEAAGFKPQKGGANQGAFGVQNRERTE